MVAKRSRHAQLLPTITCELPTTSENLRANRGLRSRWLGFAITTGTILADWRIAGNRTGQPSPVGQQHDLPRVGMGLRSMGLVLVGERGQIKNRSGLRTCFP